MGRSDSPLTPEGTDKARELARVIASEGIREAYASSLGRAVASALIYTEGLELPLHIRGAMAELACGEWEGRLRHEVGPDSRTLRRHWSDRPPGGESHLDAEPRVGLFLEELGSLPDSAVVLVVGHGAVNRVFLKLRLGLDADHAMRITVPHDAVYILDGDDRVVVRSASGQDSPGFLY